MGHARRSMTKTFRTLDDVDVKGKRVLVRVDLNVPMEDGRVTDATRLERVAPTITEISGKGGKVILLAHFGRPKGTRRQGFAEAGRRGAGAGDRASRSPSPTIASARPPQRRSAAMKDGDILLPGKHPLPQGGREERSGVRRRAGKARRHLGQRRLLGRAPRARLHRRPRPHAAGLCRAHHAGRTRRARQGAGSADQAR